MGKQSMKSRWMVSAAALPVLFAGPAMAAPYNWAGFYVGLNGGGVWTNSRETTSLPCTEPIFSGAVCDTTVGPGNAPAIAAAGSGRFSGSGFSGGAEVGYNWQNGFMVYGVAFDAQTFRGASRTAVGTANGFFQGAPAGSPITLASSVTADWLITERARLGYAFDNLLVYGTAGLAETRLKTNFNYSDAGFGIADLGAWNAAETKLGWTAGAGLAYGLGKGWSLKAEYLFVKFNSVTASGQIADTTFAYANAISTSADLTAQIGRAGIDYKF